MSSWQIEFDLFVRAYSQPAAQARGGDEGDVGYGWRSRDFVAASKTHQQSKAVVVGCSSILPFRWVVDVCTHPCTQHSSARARQRTQHALWGVTACTCYDQTCKHLHFSSLETASMLLTCIWSGDGDDDC